MHGPNSKMLYEVRGSHEDDYEHYCLFGCDFV